jgi:4-hydroxybenzoate polyprenyltransferase
MSAGSLVRLVRLHTAQWEVLIFLVGPLLLDYPIVSRRVLLLAVLGVLINSYIFVLNNVADLPRDRLHPGRQASPLVSGAVRLESAVFLSLALPLVMWTLIALTGWPRRAEVGFALMVLLGGYVDVYQKISHRISPPIMDIFFGLTMAAPIPVSIWALGRSVPRHGWFLTVGFFVLMVQLNSIAGNLKDLAHDQRSGARTTALYLGSRSRSTGIELGRSYRLWIGVTILCSVPWFTVAALVTPNVTPVARSLAAATTVALWAVGSLSLVALMRGARPPSVRGREPFVYAGMANVLVVVAVGAAPVPFLAVLAAVSAVEITYARRLAQRGKGRDDAATSHDCVKDVVK